jgi:hypothetical protein
VTSRARPRCAGPGAGLAATFLLAECDLVRNPGLLLPCSSAWRSVSTRCHRRARETRLIEGYVQEFFEKEREGAQWSLAPGAAAGAAGRTGACRLVAVAAAGSLALAAIVFGWLYAEGAARGELMASLTTMSGVAVIVPRADGDAEATSGERARCRGRRSTATFARYRR